MHRSKISLQKWVFAIYLLSTSLKGVSSMKLHRDLGLTQRTAWLMAQKIRQGWIDTAGKLEGEVELDETSIGGKEKNKHESQQLPAGQGPVGKSAVVGARSRDSKVKARPVASASQRELEEFASKAVEAGATVYTDDHKVYGGLGKRYRHETVNHSVGEYVRERAHTNGIESFWTMLKRGYQGTYYRMRGRHLRRYVTEFVGRHNVRDLDTPGQMVLLAKGLEERRMSYADLTAGPESVVPVLVVVELEASI